MHANTLMSKSAYGCISPVPHLSPPGILGRAFKRPQGLGPTGTYLFWSYAQTPASHEHQCVRVHRSRHPRCCLLQEWVLISLRLPYRGAGVLLSHILASDVSLSNKNKGRTVGENLLQKLGLSLAQTVAIWIGPNVLSPTSVSLGCVIFIIKPVSSGTSCTRRVF